MADVRPFRGLRYDASRADPALAIAPPYDVISPQLQTALYGRSPHNIVRVEYGVQRDGDGPSDNRYTRAAAGLQSWIRDGVLIRDRFPSMYAYRLEFAWAGRTYARQHVFAGVRLEEWEKGVIKPHEHTLSGPKADRLELLRATRTQVSPVYCLYRGAPGRLTMPPLRGPLLYDVEADGQRHTLSAIIDDDAIWAIHAYLQAARVYIADGHHRYETALRYRDECRDRAASWTGDEPENFVLMALTDAADPGLVVLPTHRVVHRQTSDAFYAVTRWFDVEDLGELTGAADASALIGRLDAAAGATAFVAAGLRPGRAHLLTLRDRASVEKLMPESQPEAWKRLDVSVLQYAILDSVFGIDDAALAAGGAVSYTQDPAEAVAATLAGNVAFLLMATPVDQVLAVADAGGRMPQKSTYFYPKLPTGLVMHPFF